MSPEATEQQPEVASSPASLTSDPPLSSSSHSSSDNANSPPPSPPFSPEDRDTQSHTPNTNPYVERVLANMPSPVVADEDDSIPASEDAAKRRQLRQTLREEVEREVARALSDQPSDQT